MSPKDARIKLGNFLESLPDKVFSFLLDKKLELNILPIDIAEGYGLTLGEVGNVCEGIRRVLAGEDSAANLVSFIEKDQNIEEDNREKIPQIAYEIQTKIFDVVFPLFKQAGLPLKEGRVPQPSIKYQVASSKGQAGGGAGEAAGPGLLSPYAPVPSPIGPSSIRPVGPIRPISPDSSFSKARPTERYQSFGRGGAAGGGFKIPRPADGTLPLGKGELKISAPKAPLEEKNIRALTRIAAGTSYTEDALRAAFEDLPQGLRQAISSVDTANAIQEIAKQYLLHVDQMGALASETGLVLLGLTHPAAFIGNLAKRLRLPEERAKEIAREISAKILVKVRDALRGLHEVKATSEYPNLPNQRMDTNKKEEGQVKKLNVMPQKENIEYRISNIEKAQNAQQENTQLNAQRSTLNASLNTPFSPQAKWNTGENILRKQAAQKEETLSREEVLRGIENPSSTYENTNHANIRMDTNKKGAVGPTGWRPAAADGGKEQGASSKYQGNTNAQIPDALKHPTPPQRPVTSMPPKMPLEKARPQSEGALPPEKPKAEPQNFLDEKLAGPAGLQREEKDYTTDPYREPLA